MKPPRNRHVTAAWPQVDSDFAIIKDAYPYIATRLLTDRSPQLQNALKQLIFDSSGETAA